MATFKHLTRSGKMQAEKKRLYSVRLCFLNPNADHDIIVPATSKTNALWVAAEYKFQRHLDAQIGDIKRAA